MSHFFRHIQTFFRELRRRNVYKVAITYIVVGFFGMQAVDLLIPATKLPGWADQFFLAILIIGFPIALVVAWAFEMSPEGIRKTPNTDEPPPNREAESMQSTAPVLLTLTAFLIIAALGYWFWPDGGTSEPEVRERTVAVLPFQVSGAGADTWRDGMVTMLSTGLDGAAGFRAIADRTIFARWENYTKKGSGVTKDEALTVAQQVGAGYAVIGSAVQMGEELRFAADVHATGSGKELGQVEVRGSTDRVSHLADSLTRQVLGVMLEKSGEALPSVNLAKLTTTSLSALKSFLSGERKYRAGKYEAAVRDFREATREDTSFALAYVRLALSRWWTGEVPTASIKNALKLSQRLSPRERNRLQAFHLFVAQRKNVAVSDTLRQLTDKYPDDPQIWYLYGEVLYHGFVPGGWPEADKAFQKANQLDPGVAPYYTHLVTLAMSFHHDSALAARRIEKHPDGIQKTRFQTYWKLIFGNADQQQSARRELDTLSVRLKFPQPIYSFTHPNEIEVYDEVLHILRKRKDTDHDNLTRLLVRNALNRGKIQQAYNYFRQINTGRQQWSCYHALQLSVGYNIPDSITTSGFDVDNFPAEPTPIPLICAGIDLVKLGKADELNKLANNYRVLADSFWGDQSYDNMIEMTKNELKGYAAWRNGKLKEAADHWSRANAAFLFGAIWRGDLYREMGQLGKAEDWYVAAWHYPLTHDRLGRLYEQMNKPKKAAAAYRRFIKAWKKADPELQPRVQQARERLEQLVKSEKAEIKTKTMNLAGREVRIVVQKER